MASAQAACLGQICAYRPQPLWNLCVVTSQAYLPTAYEQIVAITTQYTYRLVKYVLIFDPNKIHYKMYTKIVHTDADVWRVSEYCDNCESL